MSSELGTAQPQLVYSLILFYIFLNVVSEKQRIYIKKDIAKIVIVFEKDIEN